MKSSSIANIGTFDFHKE